MSYSVKATRDGGHLILHDRKPVGHVRQTTNGYTLTLFNGVCISVDDSLTPITDAFNMALPHLETAA